MTTSETIPKFVGDSSEAKEYYGFLENETTMKAFFEDFCGLMDAQPNRTNPLMVGLYTFKSDTSKKLILATQPETFYHPGSVAQAVRRFETVTGVWTREWNNASLDQKDLSVRLFPGTLNTAAHALETCSTFLQSIQAGFLRKSPQGHHDHIACKKRAIEISGGAVEYQRMSWRTAAHTIASSPGSMIHIHTKTTEYPLAIMNAVKTQEALTDLVFLWITAGDGHHILIPKKTFTDVTVRKAFYKAKLSRKLFRDVRRVKFGGVPIPGTVDFSGNVTYSRVTSLKMTTAPTTAAYEMLPSSDSVEPTPFTSVSA